METMVDSNVILDIVTEDKKWFGWSSEAMASRSEVSLLAINPIIYAEVSIGFHRIEDVEEVLPPTRFLRCSLPWEAAFLAGKVFLEYRKKGGEKRSPLPDFYIGAHAAVKGMTLLTRDASRYRTYFPKLTIIAPGGNDSSS